MKEVYKPLFEPFTFRNGVQLKNRIVMAPMTTFSANPDDTASNAEIDYYTARAGGPGMVITACAYVQENGKGFEGQFAADRDTMIPSLRRVASSIKEKVEQGKEKEIKTTISPSDQALLTIPDPLWELILNVPDWFPIEKETIQK